MKLELTEAELKLRDELDAALVAINNGTMKLYSEEEFWAMSNALIKELHEKQRRTQSKKRTKPQFGNIAVV